MEVQARISREKLQARIGRETIVIVDDVEAQRAFARGPGEAPEIDGQIVIDGSWDLHPGDFVEVAITDADEHDLIARPLYPEE